MPKSGDPGDHPGVTIIQMVNDPSINESSLETLLAAGAEFLGFYTVTAGTFAVTATNYKKGA